ncbi:hypothetical protein FPZ43_01465 [Mucilaginibacter pallidiroseus]|uniref:Polysaccharide biosynthesis protein C-terminal domain-containing protein n=1 Tax=Mucilaginibacter pallidiroseus TaxID=2599295 RepID=A0A563UIP9_9SPHI|nr:hypothetical protein [Mucilaginibacter pallidiroseus]TWR31173.1 hypothetical protein FPZ43_01465 [Mucilaginibacter pallidiroseus]
MISFIRKASSKIGIDGAIAFTLLSRAVQGFGSIGSVIFIGTFLSPEERGYFYTFASILAIQVFFELGLSGIITQYTAHEFAHLTWAGNDLEGDDYYRSRLSSLMHFFVKWFGIISIFLFFVLIASGFYFFSKFGNNDNVSWKNPWIILCVATSLNLFIDPMLAYMDGLGEVKDMAKLRMVQKTAYVFLQFLFFALGFKLYSAALASLISILINFIQLASRERRLKIIGIWKIRGDSVINYMAEIFPYQWRIALSWISGYFIFQLFNPVLFAYAGKVVAGQMGMSLQVLNGISNLSMSWITTKIPLLASLIVHKKFAESNSVFNNTVKNLLIVNIAGVMVFYGGVVFLNYTSNHFSNKFLPPVATLMLCAVTIINQLIFSWATYLRCHKQEPFLVNSIVIGLLCGISTITLGKYLGVMGVVGGYTLISIAISLPWAYYIFKSKIRLWHQSKIISLTAAVIT